MRELIRLSCNQRFRQVFSQFILFAVQFWWLGKQKRFLSQEQLDLRYRRLYRQQAQKFTATAIDLGGLLIKLGQFFSSRVDILPQEYTDELAKLQDAVEPVDTAIIRERIEQQLSGPIEGIFATFDNQPLAAASLGQVHRAKLLNGAMVAVKVLRPGIEEIIAVDLETLKVLIAFAKRYPRISNSVDLDQVYLEFRETISDELDYLKEADNAEKFNEMFREDDSVYVPKVFKEYTTQKIVTLEFVTGYKINDFQALERAGLDQKEIAAKLLACYLRQVLVEGFFHADPHPGNLLISKDGALILLDFGMVGRVNKAMKDSMINLAAALFKKDAGAVVEAFDQLGFLRPQADRSTILKSVRLALANLFGDTMDLGKIDFNELSLELRELVYTQPFQIPAQTTFLGKAVITVFGLCNGLDKNFDLIGAAKPYVEEMFLPKLDAVGGNLFFDQLKKTLLNVVGIPEKLNRFIDGVESGEVRLHPARGFEQRLLEQQSYLANRIVKAVLASGFIVSGTQLLDNYYVLGISLISVGGAVALMLLGRGFTGRRRRGGMGSMGSGFKKPRLHP
ncbi:MAG: AarF/ABC1/UbiB kinase family protein [Carboxydocellales bacterium]